MCALNSKILVLMIGKVVEFEFQDETIVKGVLLYVDDSSFAIKLSNNIFSYRIIEGIVSASCEWDETFSRKWEENAEQFLEDVNDNDDEEQEDDE